MRGEAEKELDQPETSQVLAIKPRDIKGTKNRLLVQVGDEVKIGSRLVEHKDDTRVTLVSPAAGKIIAVNRGHRRVLESILIEPADEESYVEFQSYSLDEIRALQDRNPIEEQLMAGGLWPYVIQRPFARMATPGVVPQAVYISAIETEPLVADPGFLLEGLQEEFEAGVEVLARLTDGNIHLCLPQKAEGYPEWLKNNRTAQVHTFQGPHPTGCFGTLIQYTEPIKQGRIGWTLKAADVVLIGQFFLTGKFPIERRIALVGEGVKKPRYFQTRFGFPVSALAPEEVKDPSLRIISGGVLTGKQIEPDSYVGFYDRTVTLLPEGGKRRFLGWLAPGFNFSSFSRAFASSFAPKESYSFDTSLNGDRRAIVPIGSYESVMALDIQPTFLFKSIIYGDLEEAQKLGLLECAEEDVALCSYVCHSKIDYCSLIRQALDQYEKEG